MFLSTLLRLQRDRYINYAASINDIIYILYFTFIPSYSASLSAFADT